MIQEGLDGTSVTVFLLGRPAGEPSFKAFLGASEDLIKNINGVAPVAELDGDEIGYLVGKLLPKSAKRIRWIYEYDFGDSWRHEVLFEGFPPIDPKAKAPVCIERERACPPVDCGGPHGCSDYLDAIADQEHERHDQML